MNRKLCVSLVFCGIQIVSAGRVLAQEPSPLPPPPPDAMMMEAGSDGNVMFGPAGARVELLGFAGMHGGKVVTGAPFSAVAVSETTQTLADGNHIAQKLQTNLFRDSQGRRQ